MTPEEIEAARRRELGTLGREKSEAERLKDFFIGRRAEQVGMRELDVPQITTEIDRQNFFQAVQEALGVGRGLAGQQQDLASQLAARARGEGTSIAELQLQRTAEENARRASGALRGVRGINPALAQRLLLQQQAKIQQQTAADAALLRAKEQQAAQQLLGTQLAGMRGSELDTARGIGTLGLEQEKLGAGLEEARKGRELDIEKTQQEKDLERQRLQIEENKRAAEDTGLVGQIGEAATEIGKAVARAKTGGGFNGGNVNADNTIGMAKGGLTKEKLTEAHSAAKKALKSGEFKQYGERAEGVAYATMTKRAKENKLADGGGLEALDNEANDTVPAMLSEGEIVVPRSIVASREAPLRAAAFVRAIQARKSPVQAKKMALGGSAAQKLAELRKQMGKGKK